MGAPQTGAWARPRTRAAGTAAGLESEPRATFSCGLRLDLDDVPEPGRIVFAYRKTAPAQAAHVYRTPASDHPAFPKRAA